MLRVNIKWNFTLEKSPWWVGLGKALLSYDEFTTLLVEIEQSKHNAH